MLLRVSEFCTTVDSDLASMVDQLADYTGRYGDEERAAWLASLPVLAEVLAGAGIHDVHLHFAQRQHHAALEYQLPGAMSWCDVVLLGRHAGSPAALIIELKHWNTKADGPGAVEGLVHHMGTQELHPSDQVRGYVHYCRSFHSAVVEHAAKVHGMVLFTKSTAVDSYECPPNADLAANFPVFTTATEHLQETLPRFLSERITEADETFAKAFVAGTYKQDRHFMRQIGEAILTGNVSHFELLDNQRRAFSLCTAVVGQALASGEKQKRVIVVDGPPGSGKSAVAARLWATLVKDEAVPEGNVVLVTTSQSQAANLEYLVGRSAQARIGRGVARRASTFYPITTTELSRLRKKNGNRSLYKDAKQWRDHIAHWKAAGNEPRVGAEDDCCLVSIVDEAHALIDPGEEFGIGQFGFVPGFGPQAYHVIRCSQVTVLFMDSEQSFRARENTKREQLAAWAAEFGATFEVVSLAGAQFRCAGSAEYVAWIESVLDGKAAELNRVFASAWYVSASGERGSARAAGNVIALPSRAVRGSSPSSSVEDGGTAVRMRAWASPRSESFDFRIFADPFEMEAALRAKAEHHTARLLSTYSRKWKTDGVANPHVQPASSKDFCEVLQYADGSKKTWSRIWNFVPKGTDYTAFVAGRPPFPISEDPLCEVGCTYAVRGFDFGYVGLLWLEDLVWRDGNWCVQLEHVHESGIRPMINAARKEGKTAPNGPAGLALLRKVKQAYRILLTRSIRGTYVWIKDDETREWVTKSLL